MSGIDWLLWVGSAVFACRGSWHQPVSTRHAFLAIGGALGVTAMLILIVLFTDLLLHEWLEKLGLTP